MSLAVHNSRVAICYDDNILVYDIGNDVNTMFTLPKVESAKESKTHNNEDFETYYPATNISFSNDGEYFFVCTNRKQLYLYNGKNLQLLSYRHLKRAMSKGKFSPSNDVIIADKAGDAYIFSTEKSMEDGTLLLGHLSMLLDILITEDKKFIITADRDEKIRVSMYPNCYNIFSYCLGHTKFITNISELPHNKNILVSSGGDGCIIFWNYRLGKEILCVPFSDKLEKEEIQEFNKQLLDFELNASELVQPVKHLKVTNIDKTTSLLALSFYYTKRIVIYEILGCTENDLMVNYMYFVPVDDEPLECYLQQHNLWVLIESGLTVYRLNKDAWEVDELNHKLQRINDAWKMLRKNVGKQNLFPMLYKRKYDNVQDYQNKKKARLTKVE
ncbi:tRNA (guanine-N(7)-)-methyltransferase non-catalytic subunit WDR4 isoform X1 [Orussus abietinus]|uniref:tRNA (guanine-N(7)-)-methyltransferase non-catalytic subunit WDR4 isoform X1 n=1 Tax=Orussus abietinus TaxID=222816 RepID=UPI000626C0B3|nr:tRNA (guanine-N(7)-)-methyltransferase non-catalytic subunit WDR4 isoform X1 [Orussus abietinus]